MAEYCDDYSDYQLDVESFETHYADEIEGRAVYPVPSPEEMPALQLSLFGDASR